MTLRCLSFRCLRVFAGVTLLLLGQTTAADAQTTFTVCTTGGCNFTTVTDAIAGASAGDTLDIGPETFVEETIVVDKDLLLRGSGADSTTLSAINTSVVIVDAGVVAEIARLRILGGVAAEGGGIHNSGILTVRRAIIEAGFAVLNGGGIWTEDDLTLDRVSVLNNAADPIGSPDGAGGGIFIRNLLATVTITDSIISDNAARSGGGIENRGDLTVNRTTISNNLTTDGTATGGAGGGLANTLSGDAEIRNSTISGNTSHNLAGGVMVAAGIVVLSNTTVTGNEALALSDIFGRSGGGVYLTTMGALTLNNVTITDNTGGFGAGIYNDADVFGNSGVVTMRNTIIADQASLGTDCDGAFAPVFVSDGYNIDSDGSCGLVALGDQPMALTPGLEPLADYGGPTETHNLTSISDAIDMGTPAGCEADVDGDGVTDGLINADQRGQIRVDVVSVAGGPCDIGAVEFNLLLNGMMEDDKDGDRQADHWTPVNFRKQDRQVCRKKVAHAGKCAVHVRGIRNTTKELFQTVIKFGVAGNIYELVVYAASKNASVGSLDIVLLFEDAAGTVAEVTMPIATGSHKYQRFVFNVAAPILHTTITAYAIRSSMDPGGQVLIDDVSLVR